MEVREVENLRPDATITLRVNRFTAEQFARRTLTEDEFAKLVHEVLVSLQAEMRMVLMTIISDMGLAAPAKRCANCGDEMDGITHGRSECNEP